MTISPTLVRLWHISGNEILDQSDVTSVEKDDLTFSASQAFTFVLLLC